MIGSFRLPLSLTSGDTTLPTITTATVEDANPDKLVVVFSEVVTITNTTGLTITGDATPTLSAPIGSGSNTITFTLSTALTNGQSVTLNVAGTNTITDAANNALATTTKAITNNVAAASTVDVDYQAVLDFATVQSIALPTTTQQDLDNQRMVDFKASGAYAKSDIVFNFESTASVAFKLICWKRKILAISYGSPTWSNDGWKGNGTNAYIDPLYDTRTASSKWILNSAAVIWKSFSITGIGCIIGGFGGGGYTLVITDNGVESYASIQGSSSKVSSYGVLGLNMVSRESDVLIKYNNLDRNTTSTSIWAEKLFIGARNRVDNGTIDQYSNEGIGFIAIGGAMFAEYAAIKTAING